ncbi:MAG: EAL domain-containing protein [Aliidiomarina sp.]|uniref:putative bifunctional diguanylate cyclase/phosphodiesterase n=1 Tax=Aliidiomarina sp. TaxID=1872439 RepID=UPI0025BD4795|nr:GGDEF domain-containing phosphodiesterase [Aliidiomarina sp.]MCH8501980.1 EAL domain-containing protein [Aliidiomarina sp.]
MQKPTHAADAAFSQHCPESWSPWTKSIFDQLLDAVLVTDLDGQILTLNAAVSRLFGYSETELLGQNVTVLMPSSMAIHHNQMKHQASKQLDTQPRVIGKTRELEARRRDGTRFPVMIHLSRIKWQGQVRYVATLRDISAEREAAETIEALSLFDDSTGLPNRSHFLRLVDHVLQTQSIKVIAINMDFFNRVNIVVGYKEGGDILRVIGRRLERFVADFDGFVGKDIEDRFWLAVPVDDDAPGEFNHERSRSLLALLRQEVIVNGRSYFFTGSIGMAKAKRGSEATQLIANAETAVHEAKAAGRDQYSEYKHVMTSQVVQEFRLEEQLRHALKTNQLECWLQSKVDKAGRWVSAEALVRWRYYDEFIPPFQFIPLAERLGLILPIGEFMLASVAKILAEIKHMAPGFQIAVNVSPRQFRSEKFAQMVLSTLSRFEAPPENLKLEITESLLVHDIDHVKRTMETLSKAGVTFSIDDFGTGYSNLRRLQWIPVSEVKIDRAFVEGGLQSERGRTLLDTILLMGENLGMQRVAEGIETQAQFDFLRSRGCQQYQGFFFHRPESAASWLQRFAKELG